MKICSLLISIYKKKGGKRIFTYIVHAFLRLTLNPIFERFDEKVSLWCVYT